MDRCRKFLLGFFSCKLWLKEALNSGWGSFWEWSSFVSWFSLFELRMCSERVRSEPRFMGSEGTRLVFTKRPKYDYLSF